MKKRLALLLAITFYVSLNPLEALAENKGDEFGKFEGYPYAMGLPFRMIPQYRHGALTGKGLPELESKTHYFWLLPPTQASNLSRVTAPEGLESSARRLMDQNTIMAMLVIKNGKIVFEDYQYKTSESTLFDSQSIAKTLTALSVGILFDKRLLSNLDAKVNEIVPELSKSPVGRASIRQTLQMQCGHEFKWVDDGDKGSAGQYARVKFASKRTGAKDLYDYFQNIPAAPPGSRFSYDPHCSDALSMIVSKVTGKTLRQNFEEQIWRKIGAEGRAAWLSPSLHPELTSGANSFYARLRDYGRLALLFVNQGANGSEQLVSSSWIKSMYADQVGVGDYPSRFKRYGYQTWVRTAEENSWYAGLGNHGQRFYIDPSSKSAMVIFALDDSHVGASDKFWDQFRKP